MLRRAIAVITVLTASLAVPGAAFAGGGGCHRAGLLDARADEVSLSANCFKPDVVRVDPGSVVTFENLDPVPHTVTGVAQSWGTGEELADGERVRYRFERPGVYPYFCMLHPSMVGAVVVGDGVPPADAAGEAVADPANDGDATVREESAGVAPVTGSWPAIAALTLLVAGFAAVRRRHRREKSTG